MARRRVPVAMLLAGVLAVLALAGCASGNVAPEPGTGEVRTVASGVAVPWAREAADLLRE